MAAAGCAESANGLGQRAKARPGSVLDAHHVRSLSLEEARCPVCLEILLEPVTMPCRHSVCLHCFKRTVEFSGLCCPSCRLRVSSWARNKQSREKSLVNTELWDRVRQSYPDKCGRRLEQRDRASAMEDVFCPPTQIYKTGEIRQEYEKQKNKLTTDEETEGRTRKKWHLKKGECGQLQDSSLGVLSDSENEEPVGMKTRHASAFVRRTRISPRFSKGFHNSIIQRSQSCTESEEGRRKTKAQAHVSLPEKASVVYSYNAGILLSSENSRSFSAPTLPFDKRQHWRSVLASSPSYLVPHNKPERSVSPESNDSISEELNHFKPIVCSPCTPPKRLPDGQLMKPTVVKSTPRNLTQSLQKSTSYEASPSILLKWKQVELDRQCVKFASKGTTTSPVADDFSNAPSTVEDRERKTTICASAEKDSQDHCTSTATTDLHEKRGEKSLLHNKRRLIFDHCGRDSESQSANALQTLTTLESSEAYKLHSACEVHCSPSKRREIMKPLRSDKLAAISHNQGRAELQNLRNEPAVRNCVPNRPTSRRGKKRSKKTKHLEETEKIKIFRTERYETQDGKKDLRFERLFQERKDRELALKLQRQFDKECQIIERHKTSSDKYSLRSWVSGDCRYPRRSGRISRKL